MDDATRQPDDREGLLAAIRLNWRLWTIIQADILDDNSALSLDLRQNLLNLSNFIDKHTVGLITTPDATRLYSLIDINKNIAAGLFDSLRNAAAGGDLATSVVPPGSGGDSAVSMPDEKISTSA